jgi:hypothetical protein
MVKIRGPLLSQTAQGTIYKNIVFSVRKSGQQARFQNKQVVVITEARYFQRSNYQLSVNAWTLLSESEKNDWKNQALKLHFTGYNLFMQYYLKNIYPARSNAVFGVAIFGNTAFGDA